MRFISALAHGYTAYAVAGTNTVSFAIDFTHANTKGLLGFAVERHDKTENERYFIRGYKVFEGLMPHPNQFTAVSTYNFPVQSFVWDDFTGKPAHEYDYFFYPLKGTPQHIDHSAAPIKLSVTTEALHDPTAQHDVFFNRGVASSQEYARRFGNVAPDAIADPAKQTAAFDWLARDLLAAMTEFIDQTKKGDELLACFYEFHYVPVLQHFADAIKRGVDVRIIIDAKNNAADFPRDDNLQAIKTAGIPASHIIKRTANQSAIQHNKFMVRTHGKKPVEVWTGSTNISEGGIFGQTNVGHWVRNPKTAAKFAQYWQILSRDPGGKPSQTQAQRTASNKTFKQNVMALQQDINAPALPSIPEGITPIFSPRTSSAMLETYAALLDSAKNYTAITLAFGIADTFKSVLADNTNKNHLTFMLLEKPDTKAPNSTKTYINLNASNNVYEAWGSYIKDPVYQWTRETNTQLLKLNQHVMYIHSKFMLVDPFGAEPIVVSGSANFSAASTTANDENMIIIKGDRRATDIYFTEFNRLFNHYYFRSVYESLQTGKKQSKDASLFLTPDDSWLSKYKPGQLRYKRVMALRKLVTT